MIDIRTTEYATREMLKASETLLFLRHFDQRVAFYRTWSEFFYTLLDNQLGRTWGEWVASLRNPVTFVVRPLPANKSATIKFKRPKTYFLEGEK